MKNKIIEIAGRTLGGEHGPLIIAEMSGNHNGLLENALKITCAAAASGAGAIKLQTFTPDTLTIDSHRPEFFIDDPSGLWHGRRLWELYAEAHTPWEWHKPIFNAARAKNLACISTAFDFSSLEFLLSLGIDAIKIASFELVHIPLIAAAARSGKPLILSTGMACTDEIDEAVDTMRANGCDHFVLLKCTSAYPSTERDANLLTLLDLSRRYDCQVGLSDHTLHPYYAFAAAALGAVMIEKHFTLARVDGGVDSAFSIEPAELRVLAEGAELAWRSRGVIHYGPQPVEAASLKERPSVYVVQSVPKGARLTQQNLRVIRPANGLAPKYFASLIGRTCACDIAAGTPLSWELLNHDVK